MALDRAFAAAYIDNGGGHKVLGRILRPFSLWHLLLLQALHSPFITGGDVTLYDLKNAVSICRLKYRQSIIHRQWFPFHLGYQSLEEQVSKFMVYVGDYLNRPEYNVIPLDIKESRPQKRITPPPAVVCTAYNAAYGACVPISVAWDMPIGEAYISEAMHFRQQGSQLDFMDDEERQFQREMKEAGVVNGSS